MTSETILKALLRHIQIRVPFDKVRLSTTFGLGALGSIAYLGRTIARNGTKYQYAGGGFMLTAFGIGFALMKSVENADEIRKNIHETTMSSLKHPRTSASNNDKKSDESNGSRPAQHNSYESTGIAYLVSKLIRKDGFTLVFGDKGSGKSILGRQIGVSISTGEYCAAFPDYVPAKPQKVILLDAELTKADHADRGYKRIPNLTCFASDEFDYPTVSDMLNDVKRLVEEANDDCTVILDCISSSKFGINLISSTDVSEFNRGLKNIRKSANSRGYEVNFIGLNHANKSDKEVMKGCTGLMQNATSVLQISKIEGNPECRSIRVDRNRSGAEGNEWTVRISPSTGNDELHYEVVEVEADILSGSIGISIGKQQDKTYAMYLEVKDLIEHYKSSNTHNFWSEITNKTGVTRQCYNSWKNKYEQAQMAHLDEDAT